MKRELLLKNAKPILFNTSMVHAILENRKSVTRRVIKPQPSKELIFAGFIYDNGNKKDIGKIMFADNINGVVGKQEMYKPKYAVGDILYVRETFCNINKNGCKPEYYYLADTKYSEDYDLSEWKWKPSMHMPKDAARLYLRIKDIRVERLHDIDDEGAKKEGSNIGIGFEEKLKNSAIDRFKKIWNSTVKKNDYDKYGWDANPWVWVIEFERMYCDEEA